MNRILIILITLLSMNPLGVIAVTWTSQWIKHPETDPGSHAVVLFRKQFFLETVPDSFIIHISADNHYRLFVNGKYLMRGPARGDFFNWYYETTDIAAYLQPGENLLAAEVINWGAQRSLSVLSHSTAFLLQGNSINEEQVSTLHGNWKCFHNQAHYPKMVDWLHDRNSITSGFYAGNPTDSIRADQYPWGWEGSTFNDSAWIPAVWSDFATGSKKSVNNEMHFPGTRLLSPGIVPLPVGTPVPFSRIRSTIRLAEGNSYINDMGALVIPPNDFVIILIDQNHLTMGYPELIVSGGRNAIIQAMYAENLIADHTAPKGNRDVIDGKFMTGIKDVFVTDGGSNRQFKPTSLRAFRYIQLDIQTFSEALTIENYYHVEVKAPLNLKARFSTGDSLTDWIMEAGWRTISLCAQDYLMSDAYYEQLQFTGSTRVHNLSILAMTGDDLLTRKSLVQADQSRIPEGITRAIYPGTSNLVVPSYALMWIDELYDYMLWKDDPEFLKQFATGIQNVIQWFEQRLQPNGLLGGMEWHATMGHPLNYNIEASLGIDEENNTLHSLHLAYTLRHAAALFSYMGENALSRKYTFVANRICRAVNRLCKNSDGFYTDYPQTDQINQITNIMAVLAEAVTGQEARQLMEKLTDSGLLTGKIDLFLHLYLFEALNRVGLQEQFLNELTEWQVMQEHGMTTFADVPLDWDETIQRSECHPWSSAPNYFFFRTVCGITPLEPGHRKIEIAPAPGALNQITATYPHHLGNIELNLTHEAPLLSGEITIPEGMDANFIWQGKSVKLYAGTQHIEL